ncbi:DMT family transporter [Neobacillus rhizophilus]|uniref:DMT family transporter n=1 Tax=Neobacillus rhizophilus TaxID=2833579 RepID=A0A942U7B3_9BACI|nr:DMT family transporter [Neobacillus rhizophilus]MBS4213731.1 DMT family transporter [Neobacillus rhizophilus]
MAKAQKFQMYVLLVMVMAAWGFNVVGIKVIVSHFPIVTITSLRIFSAAISVFTILAFLKKVRIPTRKELRYIAAAGFFNVVCHHFFLSIGLAKTTASNGGLILGLGPLLSAILAFIFLKSRVTLVKVLGIILGFTGVAFIVLAGHGGLSLSSISLGDLYIFLSILTQAYSFVLIKKVSDTLDPRLLTGYMMLFGSIVLFFLSLVMEPGGLRELSNGSFGIWMIFLASAVIATAIGHMIYNYAVSMVGVTEAAIFINFEPVFTLVGAVTFLGENISVAQILGFLLILFGVLFGSGALEEFLHQSRRNKKTVYGGKAKHL